MSDADTPSTADPAEVRLPEDPSLVDVSPDDALAPEEGAGASMGGDVTPGEGAGDDDGMSGG